MNRTHRIVLNGLDARITLTPTAQGARASTIVFDETGNIVTETSATDFHYIGYCDLEIIYDQMSRTVVGRRRIDHAHIQAVIDGMYLICNCDD